MVDTNRELVYNKCKWYGLFSILYDTKSEVNLMKKILTLLITLVMVMALGFVATAQAPVTVTLDGKTIDCESYGSPATIVEGRTLVPLRAIFESLGATVDWDKDTRTASSKLGDTQIKLTVGEKTLYKNGTAVALDVPATIINGRTMVPARAIADSYGVSVEWNKETRTVILTRKTAESATLIEKRSDEKDLKLTAVYRATTSVEKGVFGKDENDAVGRFSGIKFATPEKDFFINYVAKDNVAKKNTVMSISVMPNNTISEIVFATASHVAVINPISVASLEEGKWSKLTLVYEPESTTFSLYINEKLVSTKKTPVKNNTFRIIFKYATAHIKDSYIYFDDYYVYSGDVPVPSITSDKYIIDGLSVNGYGSDNVGKIKENIKGALAGYRLEFTDKDGNALKDEAMARSTDIITVYDGDVAVGTYRLGVATMGFENAKVYAGYYQLPEAKFGEGESTFSVDYKNYEKEQDVVFKAVQYSKDGKEIASARENYKLTTSGNMSVKLDVKESKDTYVELTVTDASGKVLGEAMRINAYSGEKIELSAPLYKGYTTKAVCFNYDDAVRYDVELVELLNKYGIKCTFNLVGQNIKSNIGSRAPDKSSEDKIFEFVKGVYEGHEISNHSMTHIPACFNEGQIGHNSAGVELVGKSFEELIKDTLDCPKYIKEKLGADAIGIAWPQGNATSRNDYNEKILPAITEAGLKYARAAENGSFFLPKDWFRWNATCHHRDAVKYTDAFIALSNSGELKCFFNWGHSYEFENNKNNPDLGWTMIEGVMKKLAAEKDIWKATNGDIYRYVEATKLVEITETTVKNNSDMTVYYNINGQNVEIAPGETFSI